MLKSKKKQDNPYHKTYGLANNLLYIIGKIKKYKPVVLVIMVLGWITGALVPTFGSFVNKYVIDLIQVLGGSGDYAPLVKMLCIIGVLELIIVITQTVCNSRYWSAIRCVRLHFISEYIAKVLTMTYEKLEQPEILDVSRKAKEAVQRSWAGVEGMMHHGHNFVTRLCTMALTFTGVLMLDIRLLMVLALISFVQYLFFRHTVKRDKKEVWDVLPPSWRKSEYMEETTRDFDYAKDIRLFNMKNWLLGKQAEALDESRVGQIHSCNLWIANDFFSNATSIITNAVIYAVLIYAVLDSNMSIGNFTMFLGLSNTFSTSMTEVLGSIGQLQQNSLQVDDFRSFVDMPLGDEGEHLPLPKADKYTFEFKNVSFKYKGADTYALKNLNLTLEAGKRLAVVGLNGAGKTTFIKLLLRLYDVTEGQILLNGVDIKSYSRKDYYTLFSPVFQNVEVFAFPMSQNISMDSPQNTDCEKATKCVCKAGLGKKLEKLPHGIDTELLKVLSDEGVDLSGGQRQKLALARALYKDAPIVVLDEPTAALDPIAEYELYKSFDEIIGEKSAVYISHRLSSTRFCDAIAMFSKGEMVEYGVHDELLAKKGPYAEMFEIQAQYYKDNAESHTAEEANEQ